MNFWDRLKRDSTKRAKAPILRELDRAIGKLLSGESSDLVVENLRQALLSSLAGKLPPIIGPLLLDVVLAQVDWDALTLSGTDRAVAELQRIKKQVEGARL